MLLNEPGFLQNEPEFPQVIHLESAKEYIRQIVRWLGPGYHCEDHVGNLVYPNGESCFSDEDADRIEAQLQTIYDYLNLHGIDPCGVALPVARRLLWPRIREARRALRELNRQTAEIPVEEE